MRGMGSKAGSRWALVVAIACLAAVLVGSVASGATEPAAAARRAPADFAISYQRSGGLTGGSVNLVVRPGLHATVTSAGRREGSVSFRIGSERVRVLERDLRRAHFASLESRDPGTCADCFVYSIAYRGHRVTVPDSAEPLRLGIVTLQLESVISAHPVRPHG